MPTKSQERVQRDSEEGPESLEGVQREFKEGQERVKRETRDSLRDSQENVS